MQSGVIVFRSPSFYHPFLLSSLMDLAYSTLLYSTLRALLSVIVQYKAKAMTVLVVSILTSVGTHLGSGFGCDVAVTH